ncbi:MAG: 30S ribosomal protein S19e [Candidatus Aenigmarchaeota archaeon]|nr:30S ribosomal protein S19e [Candidatus Aenigmarchaeota archaeon]
MDARNKDPQKLIAVTAVKLGEMKELAPPVWSRFVKTGTAKRRGPDSPDWWSVRAASILRRVYMDGPVGTSRLRTVYGSRKHRGTKREHFYMASGAVIRKILQQLEAAGMIKKVDKPKKGRVITPQGQKFLDGLAKAV